MADVIHLFPAAPIGSRDCESCGDTHVEPGKLCIICRSKQGPVPDVFVANSLASCISDLEQLKRQGYPMPEPLLSAIESARKLYDAVGPRIQLAAPGEIHYMEGELWAFPADADGIQLGPFPDSYTAEHALVEFAANTVKAVTAEPEVVHPDAEETRWNASHNGGMP